MNPYLRNKIEERASQSAVLQTMQKRAADEKRDLTDPERKTFDEIVERLKDLDEQIQRITSFDEGAAKFAAMIGAQKEAEEKAENAHDAAEDKGDDSDAKVTAELATRASFGKRFVESTAFKGYRGSGTSDRVSLPGPASPEFRAAISLGDFDALPPQLWAGPPAPTWENTFLNVIGRVATTQAAVMYLTWEPNPPADAAVVAEGDLKPEAPMSVTEATIALQTVAHYKAITRQALEDIPQVQTIVQNRLLAGVRSKLEALAVAALQGATAAIPDSVADDFLTGIRVGISTVQSGGYNPNAVLVNPADAATLDVAAMGVTVAGPVQNGSVWGLPIIPATSLPAGTIYVGDFRTGVTWFDRGVTDVYMSDSHADFFLRNQLVVLAEARAAFAATEPTAMAEVTITPPAAGGAASAPATQSSGK